MELVPEQRLLDALLSLGLAAVGAVTVLARVHSTEYTFPAPNAELVILAVVAALGLIGRRRWPLAVCILVTSAVFAVGAQGANAGSSPFLILIALYTVAAHRELRAALAGLGFTLGAIAVLMVMAVPYFDHPSAVLFVAAVSISWAFGRWTRRRRQERNDAVTQALDAERARTVAAERAVLAERLHIARELHDVVSHTLSVIAVQSGAARHGLQRTPDEDERVVPALSAIETASRRALDDLRRMLGVLRADPGDADRSAGGGPSTVVNLPQPPALVREWLVDATVALALAALGIGVAFADDPSRQHNYPAANATVISLILLACLPLAARRRWPALVYLVSLAATVAVIVGGWNADAASLATFVALYTLTAWRPLPLATAGLALWVATDVVFWAFPAPNYNPFAELLGADVLVPFVLGLLVWRWRRERDAAYRRALEAERTQAIAAERAVYAERLLIAGELHDVITHTLSVVAVQAGVIRHQLGGRAGPVTSALANIVEASRTALDDLRRMLGILRDEAGGQPPSLSPIPGLAELELLASAHRASHGPLELTVDPSLRAAPDSVQLTAFRLVQEALTNIRKYAPGAAARVQVRADADRVIVAIEDDGSLAGVGATTGNATGFGLAGMRERVALFGGAVEAGPRPGGGFRVEATLRTPAESALAV